MKWIITTVIIFLCLSCKDNLNRKEVLSADTASSSIEQIRAKISTHNILVCAHRSFHKNAPENSLESIQLAIENAIDMVEIDVRTTRDSMLVLMHDDSIDRVTTGTGTINEYTYEDLQGFSLKIGDSITQQKIPLLSDALKMAKGKILLNLDLKAVNYEQLYNELVSSGMQHEVISFIGKKKKVMEMIDIDSMYATLPLSKTVEDIIFYGTNTISPLQHFTEESFTTENLRLAKELNQLVFINTLWDEDKDFIEGKTSSMDSVIALSPSIIQTDHPKLLIDYLRLKKLHN